MVIIKVNECHWVKVIVLERTTAMLCAGEAGFLQGRSPDLAPVAGQVRSSSPTKPTR